MNPTNQETRAYIVHLTDDARHSLSAYDFTFTPRDTFKTAQPLDTDALRLVLEAANNEREHLDETANDARTMGDMEVRAKCDALGDAIAKLEAII